MKIRSGFVSNSSSSSFVIFGDKLEWYDLQKEWADDIWMCGGYVGEGYDVFRLTPEMIDLIIKYELQGDFYKVAQILYTEGGSDYVQTHTLPPIFKVFTFEKSHHSVSDLAEFKRRYIDEK